MSKINDKYKATINNLISLTDYERNKFVTDSKIFHLKRVKRALDLLGHPENTAKLTIHVAGTNGKGSISSLIHSTLSNNGFKCGLFTSPHLHNFRERIKTGNNPISKTEFCNYYKLIEKTTSSFVQDTSYGSLTVFETLTIMAALYFDKKNVEIQIIETGLGGKFDSTNIFTSDISILTPISLDHTDILGETLEEITEDKVGIIKRNSRVITSPQEPKVLKIIKEKALEQKSILIQVEDNIQSLHKKYESKMLNLVLETKLNSYKLNLPLIGINQSTNVSTAITCVETLSKDFKNIKLNTKNIISGLETVKWPCRGEIIEKHQKLFLLDGAHNPSACKDLVKTINCFFKEKDILIIFGCNSGHQENENIKILSELTKNIILTQSRHPKSLDVNTIKKISPFDNISESQITESVKEAFTSVRNNQTDNLIIITGSLFVAAEFRELLLNINPEIYETTKQ